jgi:hypothetical protein
MKTLTYQLMKRTQWQQLTCLLEDKFSLSIKTDAGHRCHRGVCFQWFYDPRAQSLRLQCIKKPAWIADNLIETKVNALVNQVLSNRVRR